MDIDYSSLKNNIFDVVAEGQIKLGYHREEIRMYYPLTSLNNFLHTRFNDEEMYRELQNFAGYMGDCAGKISISRNKSRFCFNLSADLVEYVHTNVEQSEFLVEFINTIAKHHIVIEDLLAVFRKYSDKIYFEKIEGSEFDYLIYFVDGKPDNYRYCITDEGCHMTYHRFTEDDFREIVS